MDLEQENGLRLSARDWRSSPYVQRSIMSQISQASILVVDTNQSSRNSIAGILIAQNYRVLAAADADSAVEISKHHVLDLLITDIRIKEMTGLELVTSIRQLPDNRELPVMFVSANQRPDVIRRSYELGSAFHLKKPIDANVLCELTDKALWMPHLVHQHLFEKTIRQPHIAFTHDPLANPFESATIFPGTQITF